MHDEDREECKNIPGVERFVYKPKGGSGLDKPEQNRVSVSASVVVIPPRNPFDPEDISDFLAVTPPPRQWLLGTVICRTFLTVLTASGGTGKSAIIICWAIGLTTKRRIAGFHIHKRARVLVLTFEDTADEYRRRFSAAFMHHGIDPSEAAGHLYVRSLNGLGVTIGSIEHNGREGTTVLPTSAPAFIEEAITSLQIDVVTFDPFVKCSGVPENENIAVDRIVQILAGICERKNVACVVLHHNRKGHHEPGNMETSRGASSLIDGARVGLTLTPMSTEEAKTFGLSEQERRRLIRLDDGKLNLSAKSDPIWYRLASINIGNGTEEYPNGDNVQAIEVWTPLDMWAGLSNALCNRILDDIAAGLDGELYSSAPAAKERAAWKVVNKHAENLTDEQCKKVIRTWIENGVLIDGREFFGKNRHTGKGLVVNGARRPT